jgi:hypothetical protein
MRAQWIPLVLVVAAACSDTTGSDVVLARPATLSSVSLDGAVALTWSDDSYVSDPDFFENYRVYSTSYDLDADPPLCGTSWKLEGTTVAPEFIVGALTNGVPRCYSVTAMSTGGVESDRSPIRFDTPRPDARNVALIVREVTSGESGFRFWDDLNDDGATQNSELGLVRSGFSTGIDFYVTRDLNGDIFLSPVRSGTGVELYSESPVDDLTSIDFAADHDYSETDIQAVPGFGYVFEMSGGDGFARFGAIRITHVGTNMIILDWAFQTDPGNPELKVSRR